MADQNYDKYIYNSTEKMQEQILYFTSAEKEGSLQNKISNV